MNWQKVVWDVIRDAKDVAAHALDLIRDFKTLVESAEKFLSDIMAIELLSDTTKAPEPIPLVSVPEDKVQTETPKASEPEKPQTIPMEKVRGALADLRQAGKLEEVKQIIRSCGAERFSEIKPEQYPEVMKAVEAVKNG